MGNMFGKFKEIIGLGEYEDDFEELEDVEVEEEIQEEIEPIISKQKGNKVVNIHTSSTAKVMVTKPTNYDDAR
ncbi:cell division protein SepF, partial [Clostridium perfringens]|nr:cell division protein SepF [Clostridium perfringens]